MYLSDDGDVLGMRYDNWKIAFMERRCHGTLQVWAEPFTRLRIPKNYNLRTDPFERCGSDVELILGVVHRSYPDDLRRASGGGAMGGDFQGLPAHPEAEHLHSRSGPEGDARDRRRNALSASFTARRQASACRRERRQPANWRRERESAIAVEAIPSLDRGNA